jgi:hypothetical protein
MSRRCEMSKAVIRLGYDDYVVDADVAVMLAQTIANAERFKRQGYGKDATFNVWDAGDRQSITIEFIPDTIYRMGKAAGEPDRD